LDSRSVVASFFAYWRVQDLDMAVAHGHPDVVYTIYNGGDALPFSGAYRGPEACRELGYAVLAEFDYLDYEPTIISVDGCIVRAHVFFRYRHRASGSVIDGSRRLVFEIRDGLIVRIDSYEDAAKFEVFMRMARESPEVGDPVELTSILNGRQKSGAGA
jgi:ketosteroid isomerase-like protein